MNARSSYWLAVAALVVAACSSQSSGTTDTTTPPDGSTTSVVVVEETTAPPTTDAPPVGWMSVEVSSLEGHLAYPCCGSDWYGVVSPPLPTDGGPLLDGDYFVRATWADDPSGPLEVEVFRFVSCASLPEGSCEDGTAADALGVDHTNSVHLSLALDSDLRVALVGFAGDEDGVNSAAALGSGVELAELTTAVDDAYSTVFAAPLAAGGDPQAIIDDVMADPIGGFEAAPFSAGGGITFAHGNAPLLLFQALFDYDTDPPTSRRGADVLGIPSISVLDGVITLHVYAGFYS